MCRDRRGRRSLRCVNWCVCRGGSLCPPVSLRRIFAGGRSRLPPRSVLLLRRGVHRTPAPLPYDVYKSDYFVGVGIASLALKGRLPHSVREMSRSDRGRPPSSTGGTARAVEGFFDNPLNFIFAHGTSRRRPLQKSMLIYRRERIYPFRFCGMHKCIPYNY